MRKLTETQKKDIINRQKMAEELSKYSYKTIKEFQKIFPIEKVYYESGSDKGGKWGKYNYYSQNICPKEGKAFIINVYMLIKDPYGNFWFRWNKFKNLKVFL